jgi:hypothetical protein
MSVHRAIAIDTNTGGMPAWTQVGSSTLYLAKGWVTIKRMRVSAP